MRGIPKVKMALIQFNNTIPQNGINEDQYEEQTDGKTAIQANKTVVYFPGPAQELCMSRNDMGDIRETLHFLILNVEKQQYKRATQCFIVNYLRHQNVIMLYSIIINIFVENFLEKQLLIS